ncbi:Cytochrome b5 domain-containing protein 1 [Blattella germanica]|nr:Cytochrome b5 domain-containing protein 1 [Blattella germanica]
MASLLPGDVAVHNKPDDIWVSFLGKVYDLTDLVKEFEGQDIRYYIHPITGARVPYTPHGRIPHVGPVVPTSAWRPLQTVPWWAHPKYVVGSLSEEGRVVAKEDTLNIIAERLKPFNNHVGSYTFKFETRVLDMTKTLDENGIRDEREEYEDVGLPPDTFVPCLMLYFNDDLTVG